MVRLLIRLESVPGSKFYAKKGLKKPITIYVNKKTYDGLVRRANARDWSLQTFLRRLLAEVVAESTKEKE